MNNYNVINIYYEDEYITQIPCTTQPDTKIKEEINQIVNQIYKENHETIEEAGYYQLQNIFQDKLHEAIQNHPHLHYIKQKQYTLNLLDKEIKQYKENN